jgi:hypothetical protein
MLVIVNSVILILFAFSFFNPQSKREWRSFGDFSAFLATLFSEMYGYPLAIYFLSGWLQSSYSVTRGEGVASSAYAGPKPVIMTMSENSLMVPASLLIASPFPRITRRVMMLRSRATLLITPSLSQGDSPAQTLYRPIGYLRDKKQLTRVP